jgi:hypothetical protein
MTPTEQIKNYFHRILQNANGIDRTNSVSVTGKIQGNCLFGKSVSQITIYTHFIIIISSGC